VTANDGKNYADRKEGLMTGVGSTARTPYEKFVLPILGLLAVVTRRGSQEKLIVIVVKIMEAR
jgi:hypothetical protein